MKAFQIARQVALSGALVGVLLVLAGVWSRLAFADECASNSSGDWTQAATWSCSHAPTTVDSVTIQNGHTVTIPGSAGDQTVTDVTINGSGVLVANSQTLYVSGNWGGTGNFTHTGGTVEFDGSNAQQITSARTTTSKRFNHLRVSGAGGLTTQFAVGMVGNLIVSSGSGGLVTQGNWYFEGTASKTLDCDASCSFGAQLEVRTVDASGSTSPIVVNGNLVIATSASTFTAPPVLMVGGNWTNSGTFTHNNGAVTLNGSAAQTIGGTASTTFHNLNVDNSSGVVLGANQRVDGVLTLTDGLLKVAGYNLTLGASATTNGGSAGSMVVTDTDGSETNDGYLCKEYTALVSFTFPVGDASSTAEYSPATVGFTSGGFNPGANVCVRVTDAIHGANNGVDKLSRYWTATPSNITGYSANVSFTYVDADVGGTEANLFGVQRIGSLWKILNAVNTGTNTFAATGLGTFSDFTAGNSSLPATLGFFHPAAGADGQVRFAWQTTSELGIAGFNLYVETTSGRRQLNDRLIASPAQDALAPQDYRFVAQDAAGDTFYLEEVDVLGRSRLHGPFSRGQVYGAPAALEPVDWDSIRAEAAALQAAREAGWLARAQAQAAAAHQPAQPPASRAPLTQPARAFLPLIVNARSGVTLPAPLLALRVRQEGLYRVSYEQLAAAGVDLAGVPASQIALISQGQPAPRRVVAGDSFGPGAYLEFYGQAVDTLYTDTAVIYLLLDAGQALPMAEDATPPPGGAAAPFYLHTDRWERERAYGFSSPNGDPWYDTRLLAYTTPVTRTFDLAAEGYQPDAAPATLAVDLWGGTDWPTAGPDHHVVLQVNGQTVADRRFNGITSQSVEVTLPPGLLQAGANTLALSLPGDTGVAWDVVMLDGYSLSFPRAFEARDSALRFQAAAQRLTVAGLASADVSVYRLEGDTPVRLSQVQVSGGAGAYQATFAGAGQEAAYLVAAGPGFLSPELAPARPAADITSGTAGYLMIAHPNFMAAVEPLAQFHRARGLDVRVVDVEDVYARFGHGVFGPEAIAQYVDYAAGHMGTQMVLLVGGDTYDYRHYLGSASLSFIPSPYAATDPVLVKFAPVDPLYTDLDGDQIPDLPIGRLPVRTVQELNTLVAKTLAYAVKDYARTGVFAADAPDGMLSFENDSDALLDQLPAGWTAERAYLGALGLAAARDRLLSQVNAGAALTGFFGHSGMTHWSFQNLFTVADARALANAGRPTVVTQWGCWNTYHVQPDYNTLGHALLLSGDRGAAAVLGASTLTLASSDRALGLLVTPRLAQPGLSMGAAIQEAKDLLAASHPEMLDVLLGWTLLGDPALVVTE